MFRLSISVAIFAAAITSNMGLADTPVEKADAPKHVILMFGASWCAPCIAELRDIAGLASAAAPARIKVIWSDGRIGGYKLPALRNVEIASDTDMQRMTRQYASGISGLPFSVMLNEQGRKCSEWKAQLTSEAIKWMRATCDSH